MSEASSPANAGIRGSWNVAIATTTWSVSKRRSPAVTRYPSPSFFTLVTRTPVRTGSANRSA